MLLSHCQYLVILLLSILNLLRCFDVGSELVPLFVLKWLTCPLGIVNSFQDPIHESIVFCLRKNANMWCVFFSFIFVLDQLWNQIFSVSQCWLSYAHIKYQNEPWLISAASEKLVPFNLLPAHRPTHHKDGKSVISQSAKCTLQL